MRNLIKFWLPRRLFERIKCLIGRDGISNGGNLQEQQAHEQQLPVQSHTTQGTSSSAPPLPSTAMAAPSYSQHSSITGPEFMKDDIMEANNQHAVAVAKHHEYMRHALEMVSLNLP